jgi:hypothetical protein
MYTFIPPRQPNSLLLNLPSDLTEIVKAPFSGMEELSPFLRDGR